MAYSKAETLMTTYAALTAAERAEFRAMLAGYALRDTPAVQREPKKRAPKKVDEAKA